MTPQRDIERLLDAWLADGPTEVSERTFDEAVERIRRQRQRPAWHLLWKEPTVASYFKPIAAVAAILVVALAVGLNLLPGRSSGPGGLPIQSPSASPSVSPAPTPPWDTGGRCGQVGCFGPQQSGSYTSRSLDPAVTYTLTSDWVNQRDWAEFFLLYPDTPGNRALAAADEYAPYIVILPGPPTVPTSAPCAATGKAATGGVVVNPADLVEYLGTVQGLTATSPIPVTLNGLPGQQIDIAVAPEWTGCPPAVPGQPIGNQPTENDRIRLIVLEGPDVGTLMIRLWARTDFEAFLAEAMPVVESFEFHPRP